jgi:hypothetical protein
MWRTNEYGENENAENENSWQRVFFSRVAGPQLTLLAHTVTMADSLQAVEGPRPGRVRFTRLGTKVKGVCRRKGLALWRR